MKLLKATVVQMPYNSQHLDIIVSIDGEIPSYQDIRYEARPIDKRGSILYRGQHEDGRVSFFCQADDKSGFGGAEYPITLLDGTKVTLKGPWSSRAGVVNAIFHDRPPCVECVTTDSVGIALLVSMIEAAGVFLECVHDAGDIRWQPVHTQRGLKIWESGKSRREDYK